MTKPAEPTYEYVKGKGWVPTLDGMYEKYTGIKSSRIYDAELRAFTARDCRITIIRRPPEPGENGWFTYNSKVPLAEVFWDINWQHKGYGWVCDDTRINQIKKAPKEVVTVVTEFL